MPESTLIARRLCAVAADRCARRRRTSRGAARPTTIEELDEHDHVLFTPSSRNQTWTLANGDATYEFGRPARFASNNYRRGARRRARGRRHRADLGLHGRRRDRRGPARPRAARVGDAPDRGPRGLSGAPEPAAAAVAVPRSPREVRSTRRRGLAVSDDDHAATTLAHVRQVYLAAVRHADPARARDLHRRPLGLARGAARAFDG